MAGKAEASSSSLPTNNTELYERVRKKAKIHLIINKIAVGILIALNIAMVSMLYVGVVQYLTISATPLLSAAFLIGIVIALNDLKVDTYGVTPYNATQFANPLLMSARAIGHIIFTPSVGLIRKLDLIDYGNTKTAYTINNHLENGTFELVAQRYGKHIGNLQKYKFIGEDHAKEMTELYEKHTKFTAKKKKYEKLQLIKPKDGISQENPYVDKLKNAEAELKNIEDNWITLRGKIGKVLPRPQKKTKPAK